MREGFTHDLQHLGLGLPRFKVRQFGMVRSGFLGCCCFGFLSLELLTQTSQNQARKQIVDAAECNRTFTKTDEVEVLCEDV